MLERESCVRILQCCLIRIDINSLISWNENLSLMMAIERNSFSLLSNLDILDRPAAEI